MTPFAFHMRLANDALDCAAASLNHTPPAVFREMRLSAAMRWLRCARKNLALAAGELNRARSGKQSDTSRPSPHSLPMGLPQIH